MGETFQEQLCRRIAWTLANSPVCDRLGYEGLAYLKLPGPHYYQVLRGLHRFLRPKTYVEIGVRDGRSMQLAFPETKCIGIDPSPTWTLAKPNHSLCKMSSNAFFAHAPIHGGFSFDLAFVDGDHSFQQALCDFENLERHAHANSVIAIHDVIPLDEFTATPECHTSFWTGDVWRLMHAIVEGRPDLTAFTVACPMTGLGLVLGFNEKKGIPDFNVEVSSAIGLDMEWSALVERLNIIDNDPAAFTKALGVKEQAA